MNSKKLTAQCAVLQGSYWVAVCAINGFATVFLLHIGLKSSQIGVVLALGNILGVILQPFVAAAADRAKRVTLQQMTAGMAIAIILLLILMQCMSKMVPGIVLSFLIVNMLLQMVQPLINSISLYYVNHGIYVDFGIGRGVGSASYAVAASFLGILIGRYYGLAIMAVGCLSFAVMFVTLISMPVVKDPNESKKEEQKKTWRCLLPHFLLWCVLNTCCLILIRTKGVLSLFSAAVAAIILLFETIFAFQKEEAWKEKTRRREYMTSRQLQYYAKQYEALSHFQETMRKERHERKNRNMELLMLAKKGDFDSLICRLNEEQSLMTPHSSTTGNRTVDAVLDFEKAVAREKKIEVEESISIPREMEVADSVLCGVLGNALDNAIEACDRVSEKERLVKIFMKVERKNLFIEIKNRYDGTIFKAQDGRLISRKENPQEHGMGLRIIHELLEHADGNVETMWDEHVFTLRVMIYHVI